MNAIGAIAQAILRGNAPCRTMASVLEDLAEEAGVVVEAVAVEASEAAFAKSATSATD